MGLFSTTDGRKERFDTLKQTVDLGLKQFIRTGKALKEIRDEQLYRVSYTTFAQCCEIEWKISDRHAGRLIAAYETAEEIGPVGHDVELSERQLRPLTALPVDQKRAAFEEALADGATPEAIERAAAKRKPRKKKIAIEKPLRFRLPGAIVVITPNKKYHGLAATIDHLVRATTERQQDAA